MASIGSWGSALVFTTSDYRILTFKDLKRTASATWASHSRVGQKDRTEFVRPDLQQVTFTIELNAMLGVRPRDTIEAIVAAVENGQVAPLVIGGRKVGGDLWKITKATDAWETVYTRGELVRAKVDVTMEEYL